LLLPALLVAGAPVLLAADAPVPPDRALILVRLPASATLAFDSDATKQTGPERLFVTPPLPAGKKYTYELKAVWTENGEKREETRTVEVQAGVQTAVAFGGPKKDGPGKAADAHTRTFR